MKKKTARSEFEREIRADDDVPLSCHFALKISLKSVSTRRRGATRVKSSFEHFDIVSPARTARAKDQHDYSTERTSRQDERKRKNRALKSSICRPMMMITRFSPTKSSFHQEKERQVNSRFHPAIKRQTERFSPVSVPRSSAGSGLTRSFY